VNGPRHNKKARQIQEGIRTKNCKYYPFVLIFFNIETTFNQLLFKHKILERPTMEKARDRPWAIKKDVTYDTDTESEEYFC
jgi:hypothetical protein